MIDVVDLDLNKHLNQIDGQLHELECMTEFASGLAEDLDGNEAKPGFFQIEMSKGDRLAFCCYDYCAGLTWCGIVYISAHLCDQFLSPGAG